MHMFVICLHTQDILYKAPIAEGSQSSYAEGLHKAPIQRTLCKAHGGFKHTYVYIHANVCVFLIERGGAPQIPYTEEAFQNP